MSLESWKSEFYPVPANAVPKEDAVLHSLTKWIGLRKENLDRHGLVARRKRIQEACNPETYFFIDGCSCSLCFHYESDYNSLPCCKNCPLYKSANNKRCDQTYMSNSDIGPYLKWTRENNPEPMIFALIAAQQYEQSKNQQPSQQSV